MKKITFLKRMTGMFLVLSMTVLMPAVKVRAAESYTVTFRPGNVGAFALSADAAGGAKENAEAVAALNYAGYEVEVTLRGAIKVTVPAGAAVPAAPSYIVAEDGYFVKDTSIWGPAGETVDRNMDFVVDYGKLVDGVEYTVEYVDSSSGESIAPVYITQANAGESRTVTAPSQIVISGGVVYNLTSEASLEKVLDADASKNVFTFRYSTEPAGSVEEEIVTYVDGGTVITTETVTTVIDNGQTVATGGTLAGGGAGAGADANAGAGEEEQDTVQIEDEQTPLADQVPGNDAGDDRGELVTIDEEEVALAATPFEKSVSPVAVVFAALSAALAVGAAGFWFFMRKKRKVGTEE